MKNFGIFLKYARNQRNLTQEQVAEKLNIVTPVLSKWENDKAIPPLDMLCKLCNILNISIEECIAAEISEGEKALPPEQYEPEKLGETVKQLRLKNGWSQAEVGKKLFVTSQTVSKWESGGISSLEVLGKLAELYGLTLTQLLLGFERMRAIPEKQAPAEQQKEPNRFAIKITAIILGVIIFLGAIAGLIAGLVLKYRNREEPPTTTAPEQLKSTAFVSPVKEFYTVKKVGFDTVLGYYRATKGCIFFEIAVNIPIFAIDDGKVVNNYICREPDCIIIEQPDGFVSEYHYIDEELAVGQEVKKGQQIGTTREEVFYINLFLDGNKVDAFDYIKELPDPIPRPPAHVHEWGEWQKDKSYHWQSCGCGIDSKKDSHTWKDNICTVCGYEKYVPPAPPQTDIEKTLFCLPMQSEIYRTYLENYVPSGGDEPIQHNGLDFSAEVGDSVYAVADGVVKKVYYSSYGLKIEHDDGLESLYWGVEAVEGITEGCEVKKGELIGTIAEDPDANELYDGPHLHFSMTLNMVNVNPLDYLPYEEKQT